MDYKKILLSYEAGDIEQTLEQRARATAFSLIQGEITHDFNNPLAIIEGFGFKLKKLIENPDPETIKLCFEKIKESCKRLKKIIKRLAQTDGAPPIFAPVSNNDILALFDKLDEFEIKNEFGSFKANIDLPLLALAIKEISKNATQFGKAPYSLELMNTDQSFSIIFVDQGVIEDQTIKERLFKPFVSSEDSMLGMGLAIAKASITNQQGEIVFDTENPTTKFVITLPVIK